MAIDYSVFASVGGLPKIKPRPGATKALPKTKDRAKRARGRKGIEVSAKTIVRRKDKTCRFPRCGCRDTGHALAVAHQAGHKGAGGNPKGDRSTPDKMILLCAPRHRENPISLDRGTVQIVPSTPAGTRGPCAFWVERKALRLPPAEWRYFCVGVETAPHIFEPFTPEQLAVLNRLREMKR